MKIPQIMFKYLRFALDGAGVDVNIKQFDEEILRGLYFLSQKHDLSHLIADVLDKQKVWTSDSELKRRFLDDRDASVFRYEQINYEYQEICEVLNEENIPFIPLKGAIIRAFYPEPWMRTSCDIDILVHKNDLKKSVEAITEKLAYDCNAIGDHDIVLSSPVGVNVEIHYQLVTPDSKREEIPVFERIWNVAVKADPSHQSQYQMTDEYFYCYHISHLAKHLKRGGCGIRTVLDTWILNHKVEHNPEKRERLLQEAGLANVAKAIEKLSEVWFSGAEADELSVALEEYILKGGVYGSFDNRVAAQKSKKSNKFVYLLSRLFLPYSEMKFKYPKLQKWPILYPFYIVKRMFLLVKKDTKRRAAREVSQTISGNDGKQARISQLFKKLDL